MASDKLTVCELFAGVGGMTLGAARAGFDVRLAVELDDRASAAHHLNFPKSVMLREDVSSLSGASLLSEAKLSRGELTGLIGGPPCQGFSTIGRRHPEDHRNSLFTQFFRLVNECQPAFFVAENVTGILEDRFDQHIASALSLVRGDYQLIEPIVAKASDYGAPTSRRRVFFVGFHKCKVQRDIAPSEIVRSPARDEVVVKAALRGLPVTVHGNWREEPLGRVRRHDVLETWFQKKLLDARPRGVGSEDAVRWLDRGYVFGHQGTVHSTEITHRYGRLGPGETDPITKSVRLRGEGLCPTLRAGTGREKGAFQAVRPIHYKMPRVITPREAARLQSFPDWFVFDETKWHSFRQIGNSVPPLLAEAILRNVHRIVTKRGV